MEKAKKDSIIQQLGDEKEKDRYYVYALCEEKNGKMVPFYIGKGQRDRIWQHEEKAEAEKASILNTIEDEDERKMALNDISDKHKKIREIGVGNVKKVILKYGLTEKEAFAAESALINLCQLQGISYEEEQDRITNKANGHASQREKSSLLAKSMAMTVEDFYSNCCYKEVDFEVLQKLNKRIIFININQYYPRCLDLPDVSGKNGKEWAIKESSRGTWGVSDKEKPDYIFTLYRNKICGIFKVTSIHSFVEGNDYPEFPEKERKDEKDIIDSLKTHGETEKTEYDKLSEETRRSFEKFIDNDHISAVRRSKNGEEPNYEEEFNKFTRRKYFSCTCIGAYDSMKQYLGRIVTKADGGSIMVQKAFRYNH